MGRRSPTTPERTCVGCRRVAPQSELTRYVAFGGRLAADPARRLPGRGCYLHDNPACLQEALKRRAFARALRTPVDSSGLAANGEGSPRPAGAS